MRRAQWGYLVLAVGSALVAACNNSSSAPSTFLPGFIPGPAPTIYTGSITDSVEGNGTLKVSLNEAGGLISGTWDMSFAGKADPTYTISGPEGAAYDATVTTCHDNGSGLNCVSNCTFRFTGTLTNSSLAGTYSATTAQPCSGRTGSVKATKQ
jgi:hypothetical protein